MPARHAQCEGARAERLSVLRVVALAALLSLAALLASAQPTCIPATRPCQTCPPPPPCTPSATLCSGGGAVNTTEEATLTCSGSTAQTTIIVQTIVGPANLCYGTEKTQSCTVPAGGSAILTEVDTITAAAVLVPTLSLWGLGALAVLLGALALRRLSARRAAASSPSQA